MGSFNITLFSPLFSKCELFFLGKHGEAADLL